MATIINATPHAVHIVNENGSIVHTFPKGGLTIRLSVTTIEDEPIIIEKDMDEVGDNGILNWGIATSRTAFGEPVGLPEQKMEGYVGELPLKPVVYYIVSQLVKNALPDRQDLLVPVEVVRDSNGQIIGCKSLGR